MTTLSINADARTIPLQDQSVQCVVTSPPYWGLRDYGVAGQIGMEKTPQEYVASIVSVMREVWRVLKDDGVLWLNLGDTYAANRGYQVPDGKWKDVGNSHGMKVTDIGLKPKDLVGIPWRVAFALQDAGWYLRSDIIWHKPNPMPESVTDRPTKAHEYVFLLSKQARYYYDADAIAEPLITGDNGSSFVNDRDLHLHPNTGRAPRKHDGATTAGNGSKIKDHVGNSLNRPDGKRNKRSVWTVATSPYSGAHFATFPPALVEPMILAGSRSGDIVLDPFGGSGTVGRVAIKHQRRCVLLDLNTAYVDLQFQRTSAVQVVFDM